MYTVEVGVIHYEEIILDIYFLMTKNGIFIDILGNDNCLFKFYDTLRRDFAIGKDLNGVPLRRTDVHAQ